MIPIEMPLRACAACLAMLVALAGCSDASPSGYETIRPATSQVSTGGDDAARPLCDPYQIRITGSKDRWRVDYPGAQRRDAAKVDRPAAGNIHVPLNTHVELLLESTDYVYTLAVPQFGLKEI